ncbi:MAG TPA: glutaredoxin family protein [Candidatus Saccharimonadales bacterium]|nr:glutaredoxin family protein [Candidatus Saccharimonadales bacterium]
MDTSAAKTVIMYSSPSCAFCHMAAEYFKEKGVAFTEKDISEDREALDFVLTKVGQAVTPIITIDQDIIVGFDRPKIDEALAKKPTAAPNEEA